MPSVLNVDTLVAANGTDPVTLTKQSAAKAWDNTNSAGTTINDSFNISSLTDVDVGRQEHNVSNNFVNGYHVPTFSVGNNYDQQWTGPMTSSYWRTNNYTGSSYADDSIRTVSHGDLA